MNWIRRGVPRWTIRTRLAALYAVVFLAAGGLLLVGTYTLMRQAIFVQQVSTAVVHDPAPSAPSADPLEEMARQQKEEAYALAVSEAGRQETLNSMTRTLAIGLALLVVTGFGLGWLVARQSLRPVQRITATARRVAHGDLGERIALRGPNDELRELADTFDHMVGRLESAFERQRQFVANASHELRTPLTINRTLIEVALGRPGAPPEVHMLGAKLLQVNHRQQQLIDGLLALAESERELTARAEVDLADLLRQSVTMLEAEAAVHLVVVELETSAATLVADPVLLERLTLNLVQNAVRHNVREGHVWVSCATTTERVEIRVDNTGPTVPAARLHELFEPFRRGDTRLVGGPGSGLGLSIVRAVVAAHRGSVTATPRAGGGLNVMVSLPRSHPAVEAPSGPAGQAGQRS